MPAIDSVATAALACIPSDRMADRGLLDTLQIHSFEICMRETVELDDKCLGGNSGCSAGIKLSFDPQVRGVPSLSQ